MDSRITNARPREISISICFHVLKAENVCFLRDLKYALCLFQLIVEWLVLYSDCIAIFTHYRNENRSHLCQTPVSMSHTRRVHVQIQSKWPSWNVAQQVTHAIYCFQGLVNQISLQSSSMNSIGCLCSISYVMLWWHNRSFWILS